MHTSFKRFSIFAGFGLMAVLLIANGLVTKHELDRQRGTEEWVAHTHQVLLQLEQVESVLKDAESGQRGYLLTGDERYLASYKRAIVDVGPLIGNLANMTVDNPVQRSNISELRELTRSKLGELAGTVALYQSGDSAQATSIVLSGEGLLVMDKIRLVLARMRDEETRLEGERVVLHRQSQRRTEFSIWLATIVALLGLVALAWFIVRESELREKYANELAARAEWFRTTLTSIGDAVIATDRSGIVTFLNPVAEKLTGHSLIEATGKPIGLVFPIFNEVTGTPVVDPVEKVIELGAVVGLANHTVLQNTDGSFTPIDDSAAPIRNEKGELIGVVLVFRDVTAERRSLEVMRRADKLTAAARLSATVAHEINNPLAAVVNLIFIAKNTPGIPEYAAHQLTQAEQELERVAHITRQALGFYRETGAPEPVEIADLVESVLKLYSNKLIAKNITVRRAFDACPPIHGIVGELRQAISNLIANAIDAVEKGGEIVVEAHEVPTETDRAVEVVVSDNGPGIAAAHINRIFEPFFTTKKDVGTGLGLWAAKTIVDRHGGTITVRSQEETGDASGAAFTVQLPCAARIEPTGASSKPA